MRRSCLISAVCFFLSLCSHVGSALSESELEWSGHLRINGSVAYYDNDHVLAVEHDGQDFFNGGLDGRLNGSFYFNDHISFHAAYEAVLSGGQTRQTVADLADKYQGSGQVLDYQSNVPSDEQQFFSLTKVISDEDAYVLYQRIDRLFFSYDGGFGDVNIGRQALTWGNGLVFNPADLINPFAPSDIIRDYKIGSDMILYQHGFETVQDLQAVVVPRRDQDGDLSSDESTVGMKTRFSAGERDLDLYVLKNYEDPVLGGGLISYLGQGVLRTDLTWTYLDDDPDRDSFFSGVVNYDYSWSWVEQNWYGFLEFYYNGVGSSNVYEALDNQALMTRLERGEIFVTGRYYLDGMLQYEAHPLINVFSTVIYNLEDNSFLFQPRLNWDFSTDAQFLIGANIPVGRTDSEFGNRINQDTGLVAGNPLHLYLLLTYYF